MPGREGNGGRIDPSLFGLSVADALQNSRILALKVHLAVLDSRARLSSAPNKKSVSMEKLMRAEKSTMLCHG